MEGRVPPRPFLNNAATDTSGWNRVLRPIAGSIFVHGPNHSLKQKKKARAIRPEWELVPRKLPEL